MLDEFRKFIMRGNVVDMAVGVIVGAAFGKIVASLVSDILMPPIGLLLGEVDFSNLFIDLSGAHTGSLAEAQHAGIPVIAYGSFLNNVVSFLIQAIAVFIVLKGVNHFKEEAPAPAPKRVCPFCKSEIADDATRCPHCTSELQ